MAHELLHRHDDSLFVRDARMLYAVITVRFVNNHGSTLSWTTTKIEKRKFLRMVTCFRQYATVGTWLQCISMCKGRTSHSCFFFFRLAAACINDDY